VRAGDGAIVFESRMRRVCDCESRGGRLVGWSGGRLRTDMRGMPGRLLEYSCLPTMMLSACYRTLPSFFTAFRFLVCPLSTSTNLRGTSSYPFAVSAPQPQAARAVQ